MIFTHWSLIYWSVSLFVNLIIFKLSEWLSLGCFHRLPNMPKRREFSSLEFLTGVPNRSSLLEFSLRFFTEVLHWSSLLGFGLLKILQRSFSPITEWKFYWRKCLVYPCLRSYLRFIEYLGNTTSLGIHHGVPSRCTLHQDYQVPND